MLVVALLDQIAGRNTLVGRAAEPQPFYAARTFVAHRDIGLCDPALAAVTLRRKPIQLEHLARDRLKYWLNRR